jgi:ubiquinone/menaquinone biosynthesis C-methylase UbiE
MTSHDDVVRASFTRQVGLFSGPDSPFVRRPGGTVEQLEPLTHDMVVLDVACGAAHASEVVAPEVRQVVGVDLTADLLALGAARIRDVGIDNVLLQEGNAQGLPFVDDSFDLVFCLNSLHHVGDPARAVDEMVRVCKSDGRVVLSDLIAPSAVVRDAFDALHQRIDPSHHRAFLEGELVDLLPEDCTITYGATASSRFPVDIAFTEQSDREGVLDTLHAEMAGGPSTGFEPADEDGRLVVSFWTSTVHAGWPREGDA